MGNMHPSILVLSPSFLYHPLILLNQNNLLELYMYYNTYNEGTKVHNPPRYTVMYHVLN